MNISYLYSQHQLYNYDCITYFCGLDSILSCRFPRLILNNNNAEKKTSMSTDTWQELYYELTEGNQSPVTRPDHPQTDESLPPAAVRATQVIAVFLNMRKPEQHMPWGTQEKNQLVMWFSAKSLAHSPK